MPQVVSSARSSCRDDMPLEVRSIKQPYYQIFTQQKKATTLAPNQYNMINATQSSSHNKQANEANKQTKNAVGVVRKCDNHYQTMPTGRKALWKCMYSIYRLPYCNAREDLLHLQNAPTSLGMVLNC